MLLKEQKRIRRKKRIRAKIKGAADRPRLAVFRSNRHFYAELINDESGKIILGLGSDKLANGSESAKKSEIARRFGKKFAELAVDKKILKVVFDRSYYAYHGRVKAFAEGAREGGLQF